MALFGKIGLFLIANSSSSNSYYDKQAYSNLTKVLKMIEYKTFGILKTKYVRIGRLEIAFNFKPKNRYALFVIHIMHEWLNDWNQPNSDIGFEVNDYTTTNKKLIIL
jgi:hypothetical protein